MSKCFLKRLKRMDVGGNLELPAHIKLFIIVEMNPCNGLVRLIRFWLLEAYQMQIDFLRA